MPNETDSPRPVPSPGGFVVVNGRNRRSSTDAGIPGPSSEIAIRIQGSSFRPLTSEVEEVADDLARPVRLLDEQLSLAVKVRGQCRVGSNELAERDDRGEGVVQLVRHAGDEEPDRLHLLSLDQLGLETRPLGE